GGTQHQALSRSAAEEAVVLLKNEELLPLSSDTRVLITGPSANTMRSLMGGWSGTWQAERADDYFERNNTLVEAIREELTYARTNYVPSVEFGEAAMDLAPVMVAAADAEVIVICLGESSYTENPGNINDLELPESQIALVNALATTGKKLAFVLTEGRPRVISKIEQLADAILYTAYPGPYGGEAVSGILSGRVNPSGKLPLTYPRETNSLVLYDHKFTEGGVHGEPNTDFWPQYEFGHGLSYSRFEYSDLQLKSSVLRPGEDLSISVTVTNTSDRAGKEAVLLFSQDEVATITPSVRRLRDFSKIELEAGASQVVNFSLRPEDVSFIGLDQQPITEPGWFTIMVGDQKVRFEYRE
ncbi:MAG: glycoside hydrolase family 3 C-terminal domain-containing protein, partial [Bacteroidota bacterium]